MRTNEPVDLRSGDIQALLHGRWGLAVGQVEYRRVGNGSYHWVAHHARGHLAATARTSTRDPSNAEDLAYFVTADRCSARRLEQLRTSAALARELQAAGHDYVVAPVPDSTGSLVVETAGGWAVQVAPYVVGQSSQNDEWTEPRWTQAVYQRQMAEIVGRLHQHQPETPMLRWDPTPPHIESLHAALAMLERPASTVSPSENAVLSELRTHEEHVRALLDAYRGLVERAENDGGWVLTHGEPDTDNVLLTEDGQLLLIDWTTAAIAPRERDLLDVLNGPVDVTDEYVAIAGPRRPRPYVLELYALHWHLSHLGRDLGLLLAPAPGEDVSRSWTRLRHKLAAGHRREHGGGGG